MSVFNNIPAFNGLGKASLKLDFETETQLKDFARRYIVDEGDETPDNDPDPEKAAKAIINNLYRRTTGDAYMKPHKGGVDGPGDVYIITDTRSKAKKELDEIKALQKYDVQKFNKEALKDIEDGDPLLFEQIKSDLKGYGDFYTVRDMRKRSKKEPGDVRTNKNLDFTKDDSRKMFNFDKSLYELTHGVKSWDLTKNLKSTDWRAVTVKHKTADNKYIVSAYLFFPYALRRDLDKPTFAGYASEVDVDINLNKVFNYHYYIDSENRIYRERLDGFVNKAYYKELFIQAIKNGYKQLQQRLINTKNNRLSNSPANIAEVEKEIKYFKMLYSDPSKYDLVDRAYGGNFNNIRDNVIDITDGKGVELNGLGAASDTLYNNLSILDTRGMSPTYQILPSYGQFFKPAEHKNSFAGFGLDDTKQLIADICRKNYKECAGIAAHLKGKTLLQSCFNLWHWLHHNIRYEYDRDGREEVRTPLRVWADRKRGVDCDCLSVFAWCVLKCMGYNPVFELVAFNGKKNLSHIFINCDGVVVDRVWFVFNQRPPRVTKREIYEVKLLQNLGQLF